MAYHTKLPIVTDGLVFSIDAYNTKSYVSGSTTVYDLSKQKTSCTLHNGVGFNGKSFFFDGADDYISTVYNSDFTFNVGQSTSLSVWINPTATGTIMSNLTTSPGAWVGFVVQISSVGVHMDIRNGVNNWFNKDSTPIIDGDWHHVAVTYNGSSDNSGINIYIDGELSTTTSTSNDSLTAYTNNNPINIGRNPGFTNYFDGDIGLFGIYNRVLSLDEIRQNYDTTKHRFGL